MKSSKRMRSKAMRSKLRRKRSSKRSKAMRNKRSKVMRSKRISKLSRKRSSRSIRRSRKLMRGGVVGWELKALQKARIKHGEVVNARKKGEVVGEGVEERALENLKRANETWLYSISGPLLAEKRLAVAKLLIDRPHGSGEAPSPADGLPYDLIEKIALAVKDAPHGYRRDPTPYQVGNTVVTTPASTPEPEVAAAEKADNGRVEAEMEAWRNSRANMAASAEQ